MRFLLGVLQAEGSERTDEIPLIRVDSSLIALRDVSIFRKSPGRGGGVGGVISTCHTPYSQGIDSW